MSVDPDLCICGHNWHEHPEGTIELRGEGSWRGMIGNAHSHPECDCTDFKPRTNLNYLEQKYDEKKKP